MGPFPVDRKTKNRIVVLGSTIAPPQTPLETGPPFLGVDRGKGRSHGLLPVLELRARHAILCSTTWYVPPAMLAKHKRHVAALNNHMHMPHRRRFAVFPIQQPKLRK